MSPPPDFTRGFVYVATGANYRREAAASAARVRALHPSLRICLITDQAAETPFWDDLVLLEKAAFSFRDKFSILRCPYERFLFLDTDTQVLADLAEVFELLEHFDFAGHQLFEGHDRPVPGVPDAFPEFQGGLLAFRRSPAVESFFSRWLEIYDRNYATSLEGSRDYSDLSEQKSLRTALYASSLRLAVLGPEYNFRPSCVDFACAPVRVLHGRGRLDAFAGRINRQLGNRVYVPQLDAVLGDPVLPAELRRVCWMAAAQLLRRIVVTLTPLGMRDWLRRRRTIRRLFLRNDFSERHPDHDVTWGHAPRRPGERPGRQ
jgi:hypothetical protein